MSAALAPLQWISEEYLNYNPFFIYGDKKPLLHQTEVVAKSLFIKPTRILIADVIGLGKTITALRILKTISRYRELRRILIIVPSILVGQWADEVKHVIGEKPQVIDRESREFLAQHPKLPAGWYIGSMDRLKRSEYMNVLERSKWDAIVVDEAHKLGIVGGKPNERLKALGKLIMENREAVVLLLSATPHRGKSNDYLARLALIDPTLLEVATGMTTLDKVFDKPEFYQRTHGVVLFRRSKDDVNRVYEGTEVFKPCKMMAVLIEPTDAEKDILRIVTQLSTTYLSRYYERVTREFRWKEERAQSIISLLRTVLIKRGLSSPAALLNTFDRLIKERGKLEEYLRKGLTPEKAREKIAKELEKEARKLGEMLTGDIGELEEELDEEFGNLADYLGIFLEDVFDFKKELNKALEHAKNIATGQAPDSKIETLKKILKVVLGASSAELPEDFKELASGKVIVFTEFKDTAKYLYGKLSRWAESEFKGKDIVRVLTSENSHEIKDVERWFSEASRAVLITTDVAGEGVNLQYANVVVNYEIAWSPIRLEQRIGRVWRYGQRKTTYVFNLFLADALEKKVADVVFKKLYGISQSVGGLEPILGEQVLLSTIRNELLEHAIEEKTVGGLLPVEMSLKNEKVPLSEDKIIELVAEDANAFVSAFIEALRRLAEEISSKRVFPSRVNAKSVREEMRYLTGFEDDEAVTRSLKKAIDLLSDQLNLEIEGGDDKIVLKEEGYTYELPMNPERLVEKLQDIPEVKRATEMLTKYFVYEDERKEVMILSSVAVYIGNEVRYREPIGIIADFEGADKLVLRDLHITRGEQLIDKIVEVLSRAIPVDEICGMDYLLNYITNDVLQASHNKFYESELRKGAVKLIELLRNYEKEKKKLGGKEFFNAQDPVVKIEQPKFVMISSAFLPEVSEKPSNEVWGWTEEVAKPVVNYYEQLKGREASWVSGQEHYDVLSVRKDERGETVEERYIEIKVKTGRALNISLTGEEYGAAREKEDKYWLYMIYGVKTGKEVILCIRNPTEKIRFKRKVIDVRPREEYYFSIESSDE